MEAIVECGAVKVANSAMHCLAHPDDVHLAVAGIYLLQCGGHTVRSFVYVHSTGHVAHRSLALWHIVSCLRAVAIEPWRFITASTIA